MTPAAEPKKSPAWRLALAGAMLVAMISLEIAVLGMVYPRYGIVDRLILSVMPLVVVAVLVSVLRILRD